MNVTILLAAAILGVSAVLVVVRMTRGPTMLDRAISFDVLAAVLLGAIGLHIAAGRDAKSVPILLVLTLLGFVGSVSIARFFPGSDAVEEPRFEEDVTPEEPSSRPTEGGML